MIIIFPVFGTIFSSKERAKYCKYFIAYVDVFYVIKTKFGIDFCT